MTYPIALLMGFLVLSSFQIQKDHASALTLTASNKTALTGKEVCVDISVKDFNKIISMQYSMKWSTQKLKFNRIDGLNLAGLSAANFGAHATDKGILTFAWFDPNIRGISVPDGTPIYQVCFDVLGNSGEKAYFQFTNHPTVIEITDTQGNFLDLNSTKGIVKIQ
jgi:hypothetical protein